MDEDIFMDLDIISAKKIHSNKFKRELKPKLSSLNKKDLDDVEKPQPLTTKVAVKLLLEGTLKSKVCRYCLNITPGLSELDQIMKIGGTGNIYKVTIRDIVASFHPFKVTDDPNFPNKICQKCVDKALGAYLFTQQCEQAERAMLNCFDDMYEKLEKLDPIDRPKKRGRQKLNPNYNILRAEHNRVMDYAEPIINIVNIGAETLTKEPELNDLECKKCWQVLPNLESLMNHEKIHPRTMWYHCRLCGKSFPKRNQLKKHSNRFHVLGKELIPIAEKDFTCKECSHVTDNFIQHLQHVEKHKFKNIMQHLIEKKMDKLCVVCFNKGTKMMDLDKMVCLHGCHPDLTGDKTVYTLLATTLPNPKSYKYQGLCIPSKAHTMTISKRQNKYNHQKCDDEKSVTNYDIKEGIQLSYPIIISRDRFKTDHFYFYVFCDPEYQKDIINTDNEDVKEIDNLPKTRTKLVEVVDIQEIDNDENEKTRIDEDIEIDFEAIEENGSDYIDVLIPNLVAYESERNYKKKNETVDMEITEANINISAHEFSYPVLETDNDVIFINALPVLMDYTFSSPDYELGEHSNESNELQIKESTDTYDNKELTKDLSNKYNIFDSNFYKINNMIIRNKEKGIVECKVCWVFNHTEHCNNCKKPIKETDCTDSKESNAVEAQNEKDMKQSKDRNWHCNICLVTNADRFTCQCCGAIRFTDNKNTKMNFGNNTTTFLANEYSENENITHTEEDNINPLNNDTKKIIEEVSVMDFKTNSEDNIDPESRNIQNMDTEMTILKTISGGGTNNNAVEAMDVEDTLIVPAPDLNWNNTVLNFGIKAIPNPVNIFSSAITPIIGTNVQFTIGCSPIQKQRSMKQLKGYKRYNKGFT